MVEQMDDFFARERARGAELPEDLRRRLERERISPYVIEGEEIVREILEAKPEQLPSLAVEAFAFTEGLTFGTENYDLDDPYEQLYLMNLFTTVEGATDRPYALYLNAAIKERTRRVIRDIKKSAKEENRPLKIEEKNMINSMMALENQRACRSLIDGAFGQRMATCESAAAVANLIERDPNYRPSIKPDKSHWQTIFRGEFGRTVDRVLREIVKMGMYNELPDAPQNAKAKETIEKIKEAGIKFNLYAEGFKTTEAFKIWLKHLLNTANGRMDTVWFAWRIALLWELPAQSGIGVNEEGKYLIADPPIGNDLFTWTAHLEEKRSLEWGLKANGTRIRETKYPTHTGYPLSLGKTSLGKPKIPNLCESYLHNSEVDPKGEGKKKSLWKIWWGEGKSLADPTFPWAQTEYQPAIDTEELPPASFGGWLLKRSRSGPEGVLGNIRARPGISDLGNPEFFSSIVRNWDKVFGEAKDILPEENPRTWWVAGLLVGHYRGRTQDIPLIKKGQLSTDSVLRTYFPGETWRVDRPGVGEGRPPSVHEILLHAQSCGFLRKEDVDWLGNNLKIPKAFT